MRSYVVKMTEFDRLAADLSGLVQQYTQVSLEASEETGEEDRERNERIIRELNREEPHSIDEDFTYKRPHGFILGGPSTSGITTWQRLYELVCRQLYQRDSARFVSLIDHPDFISNRGHHCIVSVLRSLRKALEVGDGLFRGMQPVGQRHPRHDPPASLIAFEIETQRVEALPASGPRCWSKPTFWLINRPLAAFP